MAAIAYVTDEKMLEYFRVNGLGSVVFWRLSSKNFSDFKPGDLLFFLSKDSEVKRSSEKGIVGYGCYKSRTALSIDTMWKKYTTKTGYSSKEDLIEAIEKNAKGDIPKKIDCLLLENVMFFQSPIYLSELGYSISNKLESFTYLDRNEGYQTLHLLQEAEKVGLDLWSASIGNGDEKIFGQQLIKYQISTVMEDMGINTKVRYSDEYIKEEGNESSMWINQQKFAFISFEPKKKLYYIFDANQKNFKEEYYKTLGYLMGLRNALNEMFYEKIDITVLSNVPLTDKYVMPMRQFVDTYLFYREEGDWYKVLKN